MVTSTLNYEAAILLEDEDEYRKLTIVNIRTKKKKGASPLPSPFFKTIPLPLPNTYTLPDTQSSLTIIQFFIDLLLEINNIAFLAYTQHLHETSTCIIRNLRNEKPRNYII